MDGLEPLHGHVRNIVRSSLRTRENTPTRNLQRLEDESMEDYHERRRHHYSEETTQRVNKIVETLLGQTQQPAVQLCFQGDDTAWFSTEHALSELNTYWGSCAHNRRLLLFATDITAALQRNLVQPSANNQSSTLAFVPIFDLTGNHGHLDCEFRLTAVLATRSTDNITQVCHRNFGCGSPSVPGAHGLRVDTNPAQSLIAQFEKRHDSLGPSIPYAERLKQSVNDLRGERQLIIPTVLPDHDSITRYRDECRTRLNTFLGYIHVALDVPLGEAGELMGSVGLWPRTYPRNILCLLAATDTVEIEPSWKKVFLFFAKALVEYQHSQRLLDFALRNEVDNFFKELDNAVFQDDDVADHPEWLLIQVSGQMFLIMIPWYLTDALALRSRAIS